MIREQHARLRELSTVLCRLGAELWAQRSGNGNGSGASLAIRREEEAQVPAQKTDTHRPAPISVPNNYYYLLAIIN